ncbi:MAG TPA: cupredoxin domain-containing protein [Caulobacteraceae bacterium]|nr:cupredoxin domain-containing protein [Caulobacteraceae bacterium]
MHANSAVSVRPVAAIAALAMLLAAAPIAPNPRDAAAEAAAMKTNVKISMFAFSPGVTTVPAGSSVTWTNNDDDAHSVVADNKAFRSAPLDTGDSYSFTFTTPGVYPYHCGLHPQMVGKIVVTR